VDNGHSRYDETCRRCGHWMFRWWVLGCPNAYLCIMCGEMWDEEIALNRLLQRCGCCTPGMFVLGRRALRKVRIAHDLQCVA
jgi:hypothetical protein